ncbi:MAG TPA: ABC transporter ATP-binding protein [Thermoanaerobaculia bacterium]
MTPAKRLLGYFRRYRGSLLLGGLCVIGSVAFSLMKPMIVGNAVDALRGNLSRDVLVRFALLYVGASAAQGLFLFLQRRIVIGASRHIEYSMRGDFYEHLQTLPVRFFQEHRTGDLMSRATNDLSSVRMLVGPAVMHAFSSILVVVGAFVMMLRIDAALASVALIAIPVVAGLAKTFGDRIHDRSRAVQDYFGDLSARVQENLTGMRVVRAFGQEANEIDRFEGMNREYVRRNRALIKVTAFFYPILHTVIGLLFVLVFWMGSRRILGGAMSVGAFVAFIFYLGRMVWPLIAIGWVINLFQRGMASMKRLHEIWAAESEPAAYGPPCNPKGEISGEIDIRNLTFAYDGRPVLRDIDLQVRSGETVGIVGATGSGKSTLLALLSRQFPPPPGTIYLDGCPLEGIPAEKLRGALALVPQETFLFSDSIAENIRFGRSAATDEEVAQAAALAGLESDLTGFPNGIETVIGERGITLSGGQKQRTAIARAIVRNPSILLLDDALSAVDTQTEERVLRALRTLREDRTVFIVAHRVSSVKDADHIVVLQDGRIAERGTHEDLVAAGGIYADLYRRQALEEELEEIA